MTATQLLNTYLAAYVNVFSVDKSAVCISKAVPNCLATTTDGTF